MFQVNAHGKLDYYVNRQHKVANLTSLRDDNGTLHFDARWQEYKELSPQFSGRPPSLLTESSAQTGGNGTEVRCIPVGKKSGGRGQGVNFGLIRTAALKLSPSICKACRDATDRSHQQRASSICP